jgi:nuclear transport factor 2 (NTF2) superfamily protein
MSKEIAVKEVRVTKTVVNAEGKRVARPVQESSRKRPSKKFIEAQAQIRGFMTGNDKTSLKTLEVKNAWQRINNRSMADDVTLNFTGAQNDELQRLMREFVKGVNAVLNEK